MTIDQYQSDVEAQLASLMPSYIIWCPKFHTSLYTSPIVGIECTSMPLGYSAPFTKNTPPAEFAAALAYSIGQHLRECVHRYTTGREKIPTYLPGQQRNAEDYKVAMELVIPRLLPIKLRWPMTITQNVCTPMPTIPPAQSTLALFTRISQHLLHP